MADFCFSNWNYSILLLAFKLVYTSPQSGQTRQAQGSIDLLVGQCGRHISKAKFRVELLLKSQLCYCTGSPLHPKEKQPSHSVYFPLTSALLCVSDGPDTWYSCLSPTLSPEGYHGEIMLAIGPSSQKRDILDRITPFSGDKGKPFQHARHSLHKNTNFLKNGLLLFYCQAFKNIKSINNYVILVRPPGKH